MEEEDKEKGEAVAVSSVNGTVSRNTGSSKSNKIVHNSTSHRNRCLPSEETRTQNSRVDSGSWTLTRPWAGLF